jgi:hypothetical protein
VRHDRLAEVELANYLKAHHYVAQAIASDVAKGGAKDRLKSVDGKEGGMSEQALSTSAELSRG